MIVLVLSIYFACMRYTLFILLLAFISFNSIAQSPLQTKLLQRAYALHSDSLLRTFFNNWAKESRRIQLDTRPKRSNDTLDNLYQVYNAYYKKGDTEFSRYLLVKDRIQYQVIDSIVYGRQFENYYYERVSVRSLQDSLSKYYQSFTTIQPFYPRLDLPRSKVLLLTEGYHKLLESFLDTTLESYSYYSNEKTTERAHSDNKIRFLGKYLETVGRHWGHFFDYMSFPEIDEVMFDRTLTRAIVSYGLSCKGGVAYLEKQEGKWVVVEEDITISQ